MNNKLFVLFLSIFVSYGYGMQSMQDKKDALISAIISFEVATVQKLVNVDNVPLTNDSIGSGPLYTAIAVGKLEFKEHIQILKFLLQKGAEVNAHSGFPLKFAILHSGKKVVKTLLQNGADPLIKDRWGETALSIAKRKDSLLFQFIQNERNKFLQSYS